MSEIREKIEEVAGSLFHRLWLQNGNYSDIDINDLTNEILSLLPDISMIEHVGECDTCGGKGEHPLLGPDYNKCELTSKCNDCDGTGETTRPATLEDIVETVVSKFNYTDSIKVNHRNPSGGILRIKEGKG